jgi:hypothetical protein
LHISHDVPFTRADFLNVFAAHNAAFGPVALMLWLVTTAAIAGWVLRGRPGEPFLRAALSANWLWAGIVYHGAFFTRINPAAWLFAAFFVFQGVVFIVPGRFRARETVEAFDHRRYGFALALLAYGLAYPAIVRLDGFVYPSAPIFGMPCPTAIVTIGYLIGAGRRSTTESAVPIVWSFIAGSAAWVFGVHADLVLPLAGAVLALDLLRSVAIHRGVTS